MKQIYSIVMIPEKKGGYSVHISDWDIWTQGETIEECLFMARDAIGLMGITAQDCGEEIVKGVTIDPEHNPGEIVSLVEVDFDEYRKMDELRKVRKNVTLPNYLNRLGEKAGLNFSQVLQDALRQKLGVQ